MLSGKLIDIEVVVKAETHLAYKVESTDTGKSAWVPKSQSEIDLDEMAVLPLDGILTLPEWMAVDKGLC